MGFHKPQGITSKPMPHYVAREQKDLVASVIDPYLIENERYEIHGIYNTKDAIIGITGNQSLGRLIVTNLRLIFWPDYLGYPHLAVDYESIYDWETTWMFNYRGIFFYTGGHRHMFGTHKSAAKEIIKKLDSKKRRNQ
jgi:hypothetical protein